MRFARLALRSALLITGFAALVAAAPASAAPILLEDGVAFLEIDPSSSDGLSGWTVNGVAHLRTQSFWLGSGATGPESPLSDFALLSALASDGNFDGHDDTLTLTYQEPNALFRVTLHYLLSGTPIGDPAAGSALSLDITLQATDAAVPIPALRLYQYSDVDLFTSFADDEALFAGTPLAASVTDSSGLGEYRSSWSRAPDAVDAVLYDTTLASLLDGSTTVLSNSLAASGDVTLAVLWGLPLSSGQTLSFSQLQTIRTVPEPGAALLIGLGLAGLGLRRKETAR
jgi:hypothetical protein